MLRKVSILSLLAVVLATSFLAGCATTSDASSGTKGPAVRQVENKRLAM